MQLRSVAIALAGAGAMSIGCEFASAQDTLCASVDSAGVLGNQPSYFCSISGDGRFVAFSSLARNLWSGDTNSFNDIYEHDTLTGETECVSVDPAGNVGNGESLEPAISADGRFVAFYSAATNLVTGDTNGVNDVFVYDRETQVMERVSVDSSGAQGDDGSGFSGAISADGRFVAFASGAANLVDNDTNRHTDVFVHDRETGLTERVSVDSTGTQGDDDSWLASISGDGRFVAFVSWADNLVADDTNGHFDVFVHDRETGLTERVSVDPAGNEASGSSGWPSISADGRFVSFDSDASNLVPDDTNDFLDAFIHDRQTGSTERVSVTSAGSQVRRGGSETSISSDGRFVCFASDDSDLVAGDANGREDIFVHDCRSGVTRRVSVSSTGEESNGDSRRAAIAADGRHVAFVSSAKNLVSGHTDPYYDDIYVRDQGPFATWSNYGDGFAGSSGIPSLTSQDDPCLGATDALLVDNSSGTFSTALLLCGFEPADVRTNKGGTLLVDPVFTFLLALGPAGPTILFAEIPDDPALCGLHVYAQAIELDPGAARGISFTPGIDLVLGI